MNEASSSDFGQPQVCILMCTYNGERYLSEQLESIKAQTYNNWKLFVSDDGSTDNTVPILLEFQASLALGRMEILVGPQKGFAANFLHLVTNSAIDGAFFAFCDQDDVWINRKLHAAISRLQSLADLDAKPAVFGSTTTLTDANLNVLGKSHTLAIAPSFENALAQNIAGGNTLVFNRRMRELLLRIGNVEIVSHDWWVYLICTGVGGTFVFDENAKILYRQHNRNMVGANSSIRAKLDRIKLLMLGRYKHWMDVNINALEQARHLLTNENLVTMEQFASLRRSSMPNRLIQLYRSGVHRQSTLGNVGLYFACLLNKL